MKKHLITVIGSIMLIAGVYLYVQAPVVKEIFRYKEML